LIAAKVLGVPLVGTNHTPIREFLRYSPLRARWVGRAASRYVNWYYRQCDFVSSPAQSILAEMEGWLPDVPQRAISNPIRLDDFGLLPGKDRLKQKFGFSPFTVLYLGRLAPEKCLDLLLRAISPLAREVPGLDVAIAGKGAAEHDLKELCRRLGLEDRVKFLGFVPELSTVVEIYNAADVFVMPSTAETQSISTMQAMACGLPVIGARAWGLQEYINSGNGILIDPGDERGLREALVRLLTHPEIRAQLGQGGQRSVAAYSVPAIAAQWEEVYRTVVDRFLQRPLRTSRPAPPAVTHTHEGMR
jgi:glycosyltransferase involved in cell wall biosynthesis